MVGGRYQIIDYIDEGGMQEVYKASDIALGAIVALKVPKNKSAKKRFLESARLSASVSHPHVAQTLDFLPNDGHECLVEEFVDGVNLQKALDDGYEIMDPHLAAHILHHLARGLVALHNEGVVHRDLKPSNIMVSNDDEFSIVKITDFGVAKMAGSEIDRAIEEGEESITANTTVVGALPYMAPEVISDSKKVGPLSDVWSIGAIMFRLLTGQLPFGSGLKAIPRVLTEELPDRKSVLKRVGLQFEPLVEELWTIIESCMTRDLVKRIDASELLVRMSTIAYSTEPRRSGKVGFYPAAPNKSCGFIRVEGGGEDVFFHADSFYGKVAPESGQNVTFSAHSGNPQERAHPVLLKK